MVVFANEPLWRGILDLPIRSVPVNLHFVSGNIDLPLQCFPRGAEPVISPRTLHIPEEKKSKIRKDTMYYDHHCLLIGFPDVPDVGEDKIEALKTAQRLYEFTTHLDSINKVASFQLNYHVQDTFDLYAFPEGKFTQPLIERLLSEEREHIKGRAWIMFVLTRRHA